MAQLMKVKGMGWRRGMKRQSNAWKGNALSIAENVLFIGIGGTIQIGLPGRLQDNYLRHV